MIGFKSQNIFTLKNFVVSLESENETKKKELQQVVGSKYHDFIESGHHIEKMCINAKKIEEISNQFDKLSSTLVNDARMILAKSINRDDELKYTFDKGDSLISILINLSLNLT